MTSFASVPVGSQSDPYKILSVPRNATQEQIRRAYKKACLRHHPDKHPAGDARVEAERVFKLIAYAYTQLTDGPRSGAGMGTMYSPRPPTPAPTRRPPQAPKPPPPRPPPRSTPPRPSPPTQPKASANTTPRPETPPVPPRARPATDNKNEDAGKDTAKDAGAGLDSDDADDGPTSQSSFRMPDREVDLPLTLEELASGCVKRRKLRVVGAPDSSLPVLTICVKPGYRPGDRIRFRSAWTPPGAPAPVDIVFIISQLPHTTFTLDGDDLRLKMRLNLVDALTGALLVVRTLENSPLNLLLDPVISPAHVERVKGHGMPRRADPSKRGDLLVSFDIAFPVSIEANHRPALRELFAKFDAEARTAKRHIRRSSSLFVNHNSQFGSGSHRRASASMDPSSQSSSDFTRSSNRRDDLSQQSQPQSRSKRRFNIFR